jgi:hypothetical protein
MDIYIYMLNAVPPRGAATVTIRLIGCVCKCGLAHVSLVHWKQVAPYVSVHAIRRDVSGAALASCK